MDTKSLLIGLAALVALLVFAHAYGREQTLRMAKDELGPLLLERLTRRAGWAKAFFAALFGLALGVAGPVSMMMAGDGPVSVQHEPVEVVETDDGRMTRAEVESLVGPNRPAGFPAPIYQSTDHSRWLWNRNAVERWVRDNG